MSIVVRASGSKGDDVIKIAWSVAVLLWPIARIVLVIDVLIAALRAMWHWNDPGAHAGLMFLAHFGLLVAMTYFVSAYKPNNFSR